MSCWRTSVIALVLVFIASIAVGDELDFRLEAGSTDGDAIVQAEGRANVRAIRTEDDRLSDASCATFARWPDVYGIYMKNTAVTGSGFDKFVGHSHLEQVSLLGPNVNDDGVRAVSRLRDVTHLQIGNSWENRVGKYHLHYAIVTDRALAAVASMEKLAYLEIENANITDEGIQQLAAMKSAVDIQFYRCKRLTQKGLESLRMALPNATIRAHVPEL